MGNVQKAYRSFQRYVDILSDSGFKAVLGDESNGRIIADFLNAVLPEGRHVESLTFSRTEVPGFTATNKAVRLDLRCESESGRHFIVEMQSSWQKNLFLRCVQYASKVYDSNSRAGDRNYDLPPVYLVGILSRDFGFNRDGPAWDDFFTSEYTLLERRTQDIVGETIILIFVELYRFGKALSDCRSDTEKWCYALKHMKSLTEIPPELRTETFERLFRACEIAGFDEKKRIKYESDMISERDYYNIMDSAEERGMEKGMTQGLERGRAEGEAKGRAEGEAKGRAEVAKAMFAAGMDIGRIASLTGLTGDQLNSLRA